MLRIILALKHLEHWAFGSMTYVPDYSNEITINAKCVKISYFKHGSWKIIWKNIDSLERIKAVMTDRKLKMTLDEIIEESHRPYLGSWKLQHKLHQQLLLGYPIWSLIEQPYKLHNRAGMPELLVSIAFEHISN